MRRLGGHNVGPYWSRLSIQSTVQSCLYRDFFDEEVRFQPFPPPHLPLFILWMLFIYLKTPQTTLVVWNCLRNFTCLIRQRDSAHFDFWWPVPWNAWCNSLTVHKLNESRCLSYIIQHFFKIAETEWQHINCNAWVGYFGYISNKMSNCWFTHHRTFIILLV